MSTILSRRRIGRAGGRLATRTVGERTRIAPSVAHRRLATSALAEAVLVWACLDCGTVGPLDPLPTRCPDCAGEVGLVVED